MQRRICNYRNCSNSLDNMRKEAKYCCRNHNFYEKTYIKRDKIKEEKLQELLKKIIDKK